MLNTHRRRNAILLGISSLLFVLNARLLKSQTATGEIDVTVADVSGAVIPGATIRVSGTETGNVARSLTTDSGGNAVAPLLPPGTYDLTISANGFTTLNRREIVLRVGETVTLRLTLALGSNTESVTVVGESPLVEEKSVTLAQVVADTQILQMPLNGRNYLQLALLVPGAVPSTIERDNSFSAYGNSGLQNAFLLDGARNVSYLRGLDTQVRDVLRPPLDSISEFTVQLSNFSAQFGASAGGIVNVVTKGGTNSLHGSAYDFVRNNHLNAADYFAPAGTKPLLIRNQYGGSVGGPLVRDRAWLFAAFEATPIKSEQTNVSVVPTVQQRAGSFGSTPIFDPNSLAPNPAGSGYIRTLFPGNAIPASAINAMGAQIVGWYPQPNLPGSGANYATNSPNVQSNYNAVTRGDVQVTSKDTVFGRFSIARFTQLGEPALPPPAQTAVNQNVNTYGIGYGYTRTFSPTLINEFRMAWSRVALYQDATLARNEIIPGLLAPKVDSGTPVINVSGYTSLGTQALTNNVPLRKSSGNWDISDNISKTAGNHLLQFGVDVMLIRPTTLTSLAGRGTLGFTGVFTQNPQSRSGTGSALADLLLGTANSVATGNQFQAIERGKYSGFYAQDQWKVLPTLTVTLGVRYELYFPYTETTNQMANFVLTPGDPHYGQMVIAGINGQSQALLALDRNNWAPRVGVSWNAHRLGNTVIRAAYGIFYAQDTGLGINLRMTGNPPFYNYGSISTTSDQLNPATGFVLNSNVSIPTAPPITPSAFVLSPASTSGLVSWHQRYTAPYTQEWNVDIQKQLPWGVLWETTYVGNHGVAFWGNSNPNQPLTNGPGSVTTRRPLAQYTVASISRIAPWDQSNYQGLSTKLDRHLANGITFLTSFTYGKSINLQDIGLNVGSTNADTVQNGYNLAQMRGVADQNVPWRLVGSAIWDLPFGPGRRLLTKGVISQVLGNWQLSGIYTFSNGLPYTLVLSFDNANAGTTSWPNRICSGELSAPKIQRWYDTGCFVAPPAYLFGNAGKNILYGPGLNNADVGIHRLFRLPIERGATLDFRFETFNSLNHPQFANPGQTIGTSTAGVITATSQPNRQTQLGLRLQF